MGQAHWHWHCTEAYWYGLDPKDASYDINGSWFSTKWLIIIEDIKE